jgi:hemoglobin-like flavoprotein
MSLNIVLLRESFRFVAERMPDLTERFYEILFQRYPQTEKMFAPGRRSRQAGMLKVALGAVIEHLEDTAWLVATLHKLGARHVQYGVTDKMYDWVGDSLLLTLREAAGSQWNPELERAWTDAYAAIAGLMQEGARNAELTGPRTQPSREQAPASA